MKVSKRSLIVSIAVLCVCALSLSAASFAWFSASQTATINKFELTVDKVSDLRVAYLGGAVPNETNANNDNLWKTTLDLSEYLSTNIDGAISTGNLQKWYTVADMKLVDPVTGEYSGAVYNDQTNLGGYVASIDLWFRTAAEGDVVCSNASFTNETIEDFDDLKDALRMGSSASGNIFGLTNRNCKVIVDGAASAAGVSNKTFTEKATVATMDTESAETIVESGYNFVKTTLYFYVEGTDAAAINANTGLTLTGSVDFSFVADTNG